MVGLDSGSLGVLEIQSLVKHGEFREIGKTLYESFSGTNSRTIFQGGVLSVGGFAVRSPIFDESHGSMPNGLGLGFWSRFAATFDFPARKVYLRKSVNFAHPDRWNATGLHLWKRLDSIEVAAVDPDSPAARAGLKKGDVLVNLNGLKADKTGLFDLRSRSLQRGPVDVRDTAGLAGAAVEHQPSTVGYVRFRARSVIGSMGTTVRSYH